MKVNPGDQPKIIALVLGIVLILGFAIFRVMGSMRKPGAEPPVATASGGTDLPSTAQIATGEGATPSKEVAPAENLHELFASAGPEPSGNPFRLPVPAANGGRIENQGNTTQSNPPEGRSTINGAEDVTRPPRFGNDWGPLPVDPSGSGSGGTQVQTASNIRIKGIIADQDGGSGVVLIQLNDKTKSFRAGEEVTPGVRVISISPTKVRLKIGAMSTTVGVGQEVKPV